MRFVDRNSVDEPESLAGPSANVLAEKAAAAAYYQNHNPALPRPISFKFTEYKTGDVVSQLRRLFHGKCAYCEMELLSDFEVEHFRPKGRVTEDPAHPGYWWLAHTWSNLLPACAHCNQRRRQHIVTEVTTKEEYEEMLGKRSKSAYGKGSQFPIYGVRAQTINCALIGEIPKLVDPTIDNPRQYFSWAITGHHSVVLPIDGAPRNVERALCSINTFALNRVELVGSRTKVLNEIRFQAAQIEKCLDEDMAHGGSDFHLNRALTVASELRRHEKEDKPYSEMAKSIVDEFEIRLQARLAQFAKAP